MTEEVGAAPSEAASEEVITEGQPAEATAPEPEPQAEPETEEKELSESAKRRERKKEQERRIREELEQARVKLARYEAAAAVGKKPDAKDYSDPDAYIAELAGWSAAQRIAQDRVNEASMNVRQIEELRKAERAANFQAAKEEVAKQYTDFDAALHAAAYGGFVSQPLSEMLLESDVSAHLAYHLGKNPTEAARISQIGATLGPLAMAREVAALEARFTAPKPKTVTSAPAPLSPVKPAGTAMKDPESMTMDEYRAARAKGAIR